MCVDEGMLSPGSREMVTSVGVYIKGVGRGKAGNTMYSGTSDEGPSEKRTTSLYKGQVLRNQKLTFL